MEKNTYWKRNYKKNTNEGRNKSFEMSNRPYLQIMYTEFDVNRTKIEGVIASRRGFEILREKRCEKRCENLREKRCENLREKRREKRCGKISHRLFPANK